ncbi:MAG: hypothetical protein C5B45_01400 [Chlamydiae bacterium]|nr:MAG: hypothetical protein C5B45_01400 [Chlamydiota bacterium]
MNSTIQNVTGYSFSLSPISQNINKVALPVIALTVGMNAAANAEDLPSRCSCSYDDCIAFCLEGALQLQNKDFFHELGKCVRICVASFP